MHDNFKIGDIVSLKKNLDFTVPNSAVIINVGENNKIFNVVPKHKGIYDIRYILTIELESILMKLGEYGVSETNKLINEYQNILKKIN